MEGFYLTIVIKYGRESSTFSDVEVSRVLSSATLMQFEKNGIKIIFNPDSVVFGEMRLNNTLSK